MIGRQLDLFGGPPKPPKNIVIEEEPVTPDPEPELVPPAETEAIVSEEKPEVEGVNAPAGHGVHVQMPAAASTNQSMGFVEVSITPEPVEETSVAEIESPEPETPEPVLTAPELPESEVNEVVQEFAPESEVDFEEAIPDGWPESIPEAEMVLVDAGEDSGGFIVPEITSDEPVVEMPITGMPDTEAEISERNEDEIELPDSEPEVIPEMDSLLEQEEIAPAGLSEEELIENEVAAIAPAMEAAGETSQEEKEPVEDGPLNIPADQALYSRQYYTMRETAGMFNVNQSLLRFWENEFDILKPKKNRKGDRYFRPDDIKNLELIYHLLRVRKFTISGAKDYLKNRSKSLDTFAMVQRLEKLKLFLQEIKTHA